MKPILIICLGNPLMRDEGIGIRLATELSVHLTDNPDIEVLDLGTGGISVIHAIAGRKKVVFVDCAIMEKSPGCMYRFTPEQANSKKVQMRYSLHEGDLFNSIELSRNLGECPDNIIIFGIEPKEITHGEGLTSELENNIQQYIQIIMEESNRI